MESMATRNLLSLLHRSLGHANGLLAGLGIYTAIDFRGSITLGSILIAVLIAALAGFFTIRSKIAVIWRQEAEGERAIRLRLEHELAKEKADRAAFDREQQELRHDLKDDIASYKAQLKAMEAKTDLSAALEAIRAMNEGLAGSIVELLEKRDSTVVAAMESRDAETHRLLQEIRDKLPSEPIAVHEIEPPSQ